jgi:CubicO group peptidase (beta-lactamase class C family)
MRALSGSALGFRATSPGSSVWIARAVFASGIALLSAIEGAAQAEKISASELDRWVSGVLRAASVPGLSLAVVRDGEIALTRAYGVADERTGAPVTSATIFEAASLSKPVFAYGVLLLAREGKLDLDAPLTRYVENAPVSEDPRVERITARLVLSHATGFPNWRPGRWTDAPGPLRIEFDPGTGFGYSGEGYEYLREAVERVAGESVESFLQERVLKPLGMLESSFVWRESYGLTAATGHDREGKPRSKWKPERANVAGSLHTTAADYARFLLAMLDPAEPALAASMMKEANTIDPALGWGLGWGLEKTGSGDFFWHWGDNDTFQAFVMGSLEERSAVVVLTNSGNGLRACQAIVRAVLGNDHPALSFRMLQY